MEFASGEQLAFYWLRIGLSVDAVPVAPCNFNCHRGKINHSLSAIMALVMPAPDLLNMRKLVSSGSPYEPKIGISRAVRVGSIITVAGTAPLGPDGHTLGRGNPGVQARRCLEIIATALEGAGASLSQVVRTRILLTRIDDWEVVAAVHGEFFHDIRPANTVMQVSRFIDPEWLVEIEADAVLDQAAEPI